ncbi:5-formyltetrahydrofolate cyclo-ligase [Humidisolicoccus flavus]|uniref:5-formyltetrahydrofolate cyclo-ligase n=1 Tax=Humidisolicoccus flavus TaxID=3111414 RepID=UPI003255A521
MTSEMQDRKRELRAELRAGRAARTPEERATAARALTANLIAVTQRFEAKSVAAYFSTEEEPDMMPFLQWARDNDVAVILPIVREDGLLDWAEHRGPVASGILGILEPDGDPLPPNALGEVDLILVPAAAVDREGTRLGWGRGFFDKTLGSMEQSPLVYAVVFADELRDEIPAEEHDQAVDGVVSDEGITDIPRS